MNDGHEEPDVKFLDCIGRRWALRLLWELRHGPATSRMLRQRCGVSPSVLQPRVDELRRARLIFMGSAGYELTELGREFVTILAPLGDFARKWVHAIRSV